MKLKDEYQIDLNADSTQPRYYFYSSRPDKFRQTLGGHALKVL